MPQYRDENGKTISLGKEIAQGGEGTVYPVKNSNLVAKVYKDKYRNSSRIEKVKTMCHLADENLSKFSAWPQKILFENEKPVGFLMDKIVGFEEVHNLYVTKSRKKNFPNADYGFLVHTAKNLASAIDILHSKGIVVGDINQNNILVDKRAMVKLLDCDSFQVITNGNKFLCEVGVPEYTSPELQGSSFHNVVRTQNHDNFGLAVIIFQILMLGNHPYSGIGAPPERNIAITEGYYCGGNKCDMTPLTKIIFKSLNSDIKDMFENAFCTNSQRPTAKDWFDALDLQEKSLNKCLFNHKYSGSNCIWCNFASKGLVLFENTPDSNSQPQNINKQTKNKKVKNASAKKTNIDKKDIIKKIEYWLFISPIDDAKALKRAENLMKKNNITIADLGYDYKYTQRYQNAVKNNASANNSTNQKTNNNTTKKSKVSSKEQIRIDIRKILSNVKTQYRTIGTLNFTKIEEALDLMSQHNISEMDIGFFFKQTDWYINYLKLKPSYNSTQKNNNTTSQTNTQNINSSAANNTTSNTTKTKTEVIDAIKINLIAKNIENIKNIAFLIKKYDIQIDEIGKDNLIWYLWSALDCPNETILTDKEIVDCVQTIIKKYNLQNLPYHIENSRLYQNVNGIMSDFAEKNSANTTNKSKDTTTEQIRIDIRNMLSDINNQYKTNGTVDEKKIDEVIDLMFQYNISEMEIGYFFKHTDWFQIYSKKDTDKYSYKNNSKNQTKNKFDNTSNERDKAVNRVIELLNLKNTASISFIYSLIIKYDIQINEIGKDNLIWYLWSALDCPNKSSLSDKEVVDYAEMIIKRYNLQPIDLHFDIKNLRLYKNVQNNTPDKNQEAQAYSKAAAILRVKELVSKLVVEDGDVCQESIDALNKAENLIKEFNITTSDLGFNYKKTLLYERIRGKDISVQSEESNYKKVVSTKENYNYVDNIQKKDNDNKSGRKAVIDDLKSLLNSRDKTVSLLYLKKIRDLIEQNNITIDEIGKEELIDYLSYTLNSDAKTSFSAKEILEISQQIILRYNLTPANLGFDIKKTNIYKNNKKTVVDTILNNTYNSVKKENYNTASTNTLYIIWEVVKFLLKYTLYAIVFFLVILGIYALILVIVHAIPFILILLLFAINGFIGGKKR